MEGNLGLVLPAYRPELEVLTDYVEDLRAELEPARIRIELDTPQPGVVDRLEELGVTVSVSQRRRGKGAAITDGFEALATDVLAFADADGSTPAESMADVVQPVRDEEAALAVGSRRHPDADVLSHQTLVRRRLGDAFAATARLFLDSDLYDYQCGAKAISAAAWAQVRTHLYEPDFGWDIELIAMTAAFDLPIAEVPITWQDHPGSTVSPISTSLALARTLLAARHRAKLQKNVTVHTVLNRLFEGQPALVDRQRAEP
jgi:glycosyltransferase involved in cell wall biosynthesis